MTVRAPDGAGRAYERRIRLKFRLLAAFYDAFDVAFLTDPSTNPRLALAARMGRGRLRVLDVCTGTGRAAIPIAQANDDAEVVGVDLSPDMVAVARGRIRRRRLANVRVHVMDASALEFGEGEFDVVTVSFGLHEMGRRLMMAVLGEMVRVLREGGRLYIVDYARQGGRLRTALFRAYLRVFEPRHVYEFMDTDWPPLLASLGARVNGEEDFRYSKMVSATKARPPSGP